MANNVKIATIGPQPLRVRPDLKPGEIVDHMIDHWRGKIAQVLADRPDLIVLPEACDRPAADDFPLERRLEYYRERKNHMRDFFAKTAKENECYIVYSAAREAKDGTWRNSSVVLDRTGRIAGTYDKNHLVMEEEHDKAGILCGTEAPIIDCDFGRVACLICFDLNFAPLREKYARAKPDLLIFSSVYHGNALVQSWWAYECRAHLVSAVARLPCEVRDPYGRVLAAGTNYRDYAVGTVNLDCCMVHYDFNGEKLSALKEKYGSKVDIHDPGYFGSVLISSLSEEASAMDMTTEFDIELLDDYLARELLLHQPSRNTGS